MTREEILRNAEALSETVPDEKVRGLVRQAYIKGAEDNAVGDSETFAEHYGCVPEPVKKEFDAVPVRFEEEDGEKYPVVDYKLMGMKGKNTQIALKGWVARDKGGEISLYKAKPIRSTKADVWDALLCDTLLINRTAFPDLTWEDEPLKVVVQLVKDE